MYSGYVELLGHCIASVCAVPGTLTLVVQWLDGTEDRVDMTAVIRRSVPLRPLENPDRFAEVEVIDWGCAVGWRGDLGYGADTLYDQIRQQSMKAAG
ncbi:MAG: DUF2442 domain-containing protein [Magnetococcales bacterium]|nr:DUF2442 domain-containing protein [Magnetococcales bacterium]